MVEVKNIEVFGFSRSINAINNSFNVGDIDTTVNLDDKKQKIAKALGKNKDYYQSHDAYLAGIVVQFVINYDKISELETLLTRKFFECSKLKNNEYFITTNYRALKHFFWHNPKDSFFLKTIISKLPQFTELTGIN